MKALWFLIFPLAAASTALAQADWTIWRALQVGTHPPRWSPVKPVPFDKCREAIVDAMATDYAAMKMSPKNYSTVQVDEQGRITARSTEPAPQMNPNAPPIYAAFTVWMECWPSGTQPR